MLYEVITLELTAVRAWRDTGETFEEATEKSRILVADLPTYFVYRCLSALQSPFGILDAQVLYIGDRRISGCVGEPPLEAPFR